MSTATDGAGTDRPSDGAGSGADSAAEPADVVAVGRIGPARGVRGAVFVEPWTDAPDERFAAGATLLTEPRSAGPLQVESATTSSGKLVVAFAGVADRARAEALRGTTLFVPLADRPDLADPDEFYDTDLVGLTARTVDGVALGPVRDVLHATGADYLVLDVEGRERLVPFVAAIVPTIDLAAGAVLIDPPDGLFDV